MMASQQSSITSTSTPKNPEPMPPPRHTTSTGKRTSNANPTVSTPAPVLTDAVQKCVDTAAEAIATHREAKLVFMQGLVKRILREAYREPATPPSAGTPLAQSVFAGIPSPSRGPSPCFVTHPNYQNGQFHHYYPPENPSPISQTPTTSAHTTPSSTRMNASQTSMTSTTSITSTISTTPSPTVHYNSHTVPTVSREAHRTHTVFAPITLVESLTKTNLLLVADMKSELQSIHNQLSTIPFEEIRKEQSQAFEKVNERMEALEKNFNELKDIVMKRTNQSFKMDPKLLEQWNSTMLVIRRSPWTNMRLILNKIASDNIADLFPSDWAPKPCFSEIQEKHFKILSEVMTAMFYQCGILQDYDVLAIHGYEQFLKALHHHMVMGNVTINQLGQFLILMTYMSFCRINHYTNYMRNEDAINLEVAVWMSIVIMAFRTSFHAEGSHRTINPYFKVLNTIIRRRLHVIITRYLEQECVCQNHVQCDLFPNILTSEIILPSYQHFLQYIQEKGFSRFSITNESEALSKYGKTITMIVLARVNGYYSPYFPQTIMEEEAKCLYGTNFSFAERDFFTNKLLKVTPNISQEAINQSIAFLERQKEANCPCTIHTQKRGHEWIVFNRLPDRMPYNHDDENQMSESDDSVGFSDTESNAENEEAKVADTTSGHEDMEEENNRKNQDSIDASGASSENFTSADLTAGYNAIFNPSVSNSSSELSLISRDERHIRCKKNVTKQNRTKKKNKRPTKTQTDSEQAELIPEDILEESEQRIDSSIPCKFDQIVYRDNVKGKTYSFRYFKAYKFDWRLLMNHPNGEPMECKCPRGRLHSQQCPWYHPDVINVPDIANNLSTSEQAAQGKIYDMYHQNTQNGQQELCGCGTAAEIAYLGHKSTCEEFQWIHERSSYEMLLAILKKRKKVNLYENFQQHTRGLDYNLLVILALKRKSQRMPK